MQAVGIMCGTLLPTSHTIPEATHKVVTPESY